MDGNFIGNYQGLNTAKGTVGYAIDIVFCIDGTGSRQDALNCIREIISSMLEDVRIGSQNRGGDVAQLRSRLIVFRDYIADGKDAMQATDFFLLPQQEKDFLECLHSIQADGGGDPAEDGLEALAFAIKSPWTTASLKRRHVIVLFTDEEAHPLGYGRNSCYYPKGMPRNLAELEEWWDNMDDAKRLILCTPYTQYWRSISDSWDMTFHCSESAALLSMDSLMTRALRQLLWEL